MRLRGCLAALVLLVIVAGVAAWLAVPPILSGVATNLLGQLGVIGSNTAVTVASDPPLRLLILQVDAVQVTSQDVTLRNVRADRLGATLHDVSILDHRFGSVTGRLDGVTFTETNGTSIDARTVTFAGPASAVVVKVELEAAAVRTLARRAVADQIGVGLENVAISAPDRLTFDLPGGSLTGRLSVDAAGGLVFSALTSGATFDVFRPDPADHFRLRSVTVQGDAIELTGTLDVGQLVR